MNGCCPGWLLQLSYPNLYLPSFNIYHPFFSTSESCNPHCLSWRRWKTGIIWRFREGNLSPGQCPVRVAPSPCSSCYLTSPDWVVAPIAYDINPTLAQVWSAHVFGAYQCSFCPGVISPADRKNCVQEKQMQQRWRKNYSTGRSEFYCAQIC